MSALGWSYPAGCSGPPDYDLNCEVCGRDVDDCICPECLFCGVVGDPECYEHHGLTRSQEQFDGRARIEKIWKEDAEALENRYLSTLSDE